MKEHGPHVFVSGNPDRQCIYTFMYYIHTYKHTHIYTYICIHIIHRYIDIHIIHRTYIHIIYKYIEVKMEEQKQPSLPVKVINTHIYIPAYTHIYIYTQRMYTYTHNTQVHDIEVKMEEQTAVLTGQSHKYTHVYIYTCIYMYTHIHIIHRSNVINTHMYIYTHVYTCIHIYT
jgi:hypothetical protein